MPVHNALLTLNCTCRRACALRSCPVHVHYYACNVKTAHAHTHTHTWFKMSITSLIDGVPWRINQFERIVFVVFVCACVCLLCSSLAVVPCQENIYDKSTSPSRSDTMIILITISLRALCALSNSEAHMCVVPSAFD